MKFCRILIVSVLCAISFMTVSCSVKEERPGCPAWLSIFSGGRLPEDVNGPIDFRVYRDGVLELDEEHSRQEFEEGFEERILRGPLTFVGVFGWPEDIMTPSGLVIPLGEECPAAWGFSESVLLENEEEVLKGVFKKLYANVFVDILGKTEEYPYYPLVSGNVDGYSLPSLKPHLGEFRVFMNQFSLTKADSESTDYCVRVPRQFDNSLTFSLLVDNRSLYEDASYELALGKVLEENGYDWDADVLEDIYIVVDYTRVRISISVADWTVYLMMGGRFVI